MIKWLKQLRRSMTAEGIEERREVHRRILLSSCGGARISGKNGKMQVGHLSVRKED